jgi:hypothetical protein
MVVCLFTLVANVSKIYAVGDLRDFSIPLPPMPMRETAVRACTETPIADIFS